MGKIMLLRFFLGVLIYGAIVCGFPVSCASFKGIDYKMNEQYKYEEFKKTQWYKEQVIWAQKYSAGSIWVGKIIELNIHNKNNVPRHNDNIVLKPFYKLFGTHSLQDDSMWIDFRFEEIEIFSKFKPKIGQTWAFACNQSGKGIFILRAATRVDN